MMVKIADALLGRRQNRTNKQEYHKATFIKRQVDIKRREYSPIIIQDLNDFFVHSQNFIFASKKFSYHLFLQLILSNIVLS